MCIRRSKLYLPLFALLLLLSWRFLSLQPLPNAADLLRVQDEYQRLLVENALKKMDKRPALVQAKPLEIIHSKLVGAPRHSDIWAPMIIDACHLSFAQSGPCLLEQNPDTNFVSAQELIYPAFKLKAPVFIDNSQKDIWVGLVGDLSRMRLSNDHAYAEYPTFFGQNLVFSNVTYESTLGLDSWDSSACMEGAFSHKQFMHSNTKPFNPPATEIHASLVLATSPDSWSFQHFLDRVTVVWSQALLSPSIIYDTAIVTGSDRQVGFVDELFLKMGVNKHLHYDGVVYAKEFIVSCRAPLVHPYTMQRPSELFGVDLTKNNIKERKIVLYASRGNGDTMNAGRLVINEVEVLNELETLLKRRGRGEELVMFDRKAYKSVEEIVDFFGRHVVAMIGAHGSAFHNARFAHRNTLIVEFMPISRFQPCFYEQARLMQQGYAMILLKSQNAANDMIVENVDKLMKLIDENLGLTGEDFAVQTYPWNTAA